MDEMALQLAKDLRQVFENTHYKLDSMGIPFFYSFPVNSCQGASIYLSIFFTWLHPEAVVEVVKGTHRTLDDHHYWVELNGKVYDLTNDQFESRLGDGYSNLDTPVYASKKHPLRSYFFYKKRESAIRAYITFCSEHANVRDVDKAQWFVIEKLKEMGWEMDKTIWGNRLTRL